MRRATSIQKMHKLKNLSIDEHAHEYFLWLPTLFRGPIKVFKEPALNTVSINLYKLPLLRLKRIKEREGVYFEVIGGLLSKNGGSFSFSEEGGEIITALKDFSPSLPWPIYRFTQYPFHDLMMFLYSQHLKSLR